MTNENPIHVRLKYQEAFQTKREILSLQMTLLKIAKTMKGYGFYRSQELELKSKLYKELKELKIFLGRLQKLLPKPKIPDILREEFGEKTRFSSKKTKPVEKNLEAQLQEIQNRLNDLQQRGV